MKRLTLLLLSGLISISSFAANQETINSKAYLTVCQGTQITVITVLGKSYVAYGNGKSNAEYLEALASAYRSQSRGVIRNSPLFNVSGFVEISLKEKRSVCAHTISGVFKITQGLNSIPFPKSR